MTNTKIVSPKQDILYMVILSAVVLTMPIWLQPFGAAYPDLMQKFMIFGIFAIGYHIRPFSGWALTPLSGRSNCCR